MNDEERRAFINELASFDPVPCAGCRKCCQGNQAVELRPEYGDDPSVYGEENLALENLANVRMGVVLKRKPNGDCIFLGAKGCKVYDKRPMVCRFYDCRRQFAAATKEQRRELTKSGVFHKGIFDEARKRLDTINWHPKEVEHGMNKPGFGSTEYLLERTRRSQVIEAIKRRKP